MFDDRQNIPILPQPPLEIVRSKNPLDLRVFYECMLICEECSDLSKPFELPPREEMARRCDCGYPTLERAYKRLSQTRYFKIIDRGPKGQRRLVMIEYNKLGMQRTINEGVGMRKDSLSSAHASESKGQLDIIFNASSWLITLHSTCKNTDRQSASLADYTLQELYEASGGADEHSIATAIREVEQYRPKGLLIGNILQLFRSRFVKDHAAKCTGKLNPHRPNKLATSQKQKNLSVNHEEVERQKKSCAIYPTQLYDAKEVDRICDMLNGGAIVLRGCVPIYFAELSFLQTINGDELQFVPGVVGLVRVAPGYWRVQWESVIHTDSSKRSATGMKPISEIIPVTEPTSGK